MCYIVESEAGYTVYMSERPPVNMAVDSPSREVQAKWPGGHMLILNDCPLTSNQQEARRLQTITEEMHAAANRSTQYSSSSSSSGGAAMERRYNVAVYEPYYPDRGHGYYPSYRVGYGGVPYPIGGYPVVGPIHHGGGYTAPPRVSHNSGRGTRR